MFEIMVFILIMSFYVAIGLASIMFLFRVYLSFRYGENMNQKLLLVLLPFGIGVFMYVNEEKWVKLYRVLIVVLLVVSFLASLFLFHRELGL